MLTQWITEVLASAAGAVALLALAGYLFRNLLLERLKRSVAHEYDARLEALRSDHTKLLEEVREARAEREALRSLAFSMLTSGQATVAERKMRAVEVLWQSFYEVRVGTPYYIFVADMVSYNMQSLGGIVQAEMKRTNFLDALKPSLLATQKVTKVRPFLGEKSYALFHAAQSLLGRATSTTLSSVQSGKLQLWYEESDAKDLLASVLSPNELATFGALRRERLDWLVRHLEAQLVQALRDEIAGGLAARDVLQKAQAILSASEATASHTVDASRSNA